VGLRYETCFMSPFVAPVILRWLIGFWKICEALFLQLISFCAYALMTGLASSCDENKIGGRSRILRGVAVPDTMSFSHCGLLGHDSV